MRNFLFVITFMFGTWACYIELSYGYKLDRDLDSVLDRVKVSTTAESMLKYMRMYKSNLELYEATSGHTAIVFKTLENDLGVHYESVCNVVSRLEEVMTMGHRTVEYQLAIDGLRDTTRERDSVMLDLLWIRYRCWVAPTFVLLVFSTALVILHHGRRSIQ